MKKSRIQQFLEQFATAQIAISGRSGHIMTDRASLARFLIKRYPEFFDEKFLIAPEIRRVSLEEVAMSRAHNVMVPDVGDADVEEQMLERILALGERLRIAWSDQDPRNKLWQAFIIRLLYHKTRGGGQYESPEPTPFDQALEYFQTNWDKTRVCQRVDCPNIKFFFRGEKGKTYCSTECSLAATKEVRNRSYHKNKGKKKSSKSKTRGARYGKG